MIRIKNQRIFAILSLFSLIIVCFSMSDHVQAQAGTAAEVLAEINGLRGANGMAPMSENQYLNIAAQNHADWIVATGQGGHIGQGGNTAQDRAIAVGYGGGANVRVTENWARGPGLTASGVVYNQWAPSSAHINNMLSTWHNEFGAGVALDGSGMTVYVVKFGHIVGSSPPQPTQVPGEPANTPAPRINPVTTAEPNEDGSVIHVVKFGQTLWKIVEAYDVSMADLLALNYMTEDTPIFPDQELLIVPAKIVPDEEVEPIEAMQADQADMTDMLPSPSPTPTSTPTEIVLSVSFDATPEPIDMPLTEGNPQSVLVNIFSGDSLWVGIGLVSVSIFGIVLLFFTTARLK